jgi:hypothetical protein
LITIITQWPAAPQMVGYSLMIVAISALLGWIAVRQVRILLSVGVGAEG